MLILMQGNTEANASYSDINRYARPAGGDTFHITVMFSKHGRVTFRKTFFLCILKSVAAQMLVSANLRRERGQGREPDC